MDSIFFLLRTLKSFINIIFINNHFFNLLKDFLDQSVPRVTPAAPVPKGRDEVDKEWFLIYYFYNVLN